MRILSSPSSLLFCLLFLIFSTPIFAQQNLVVKLEGPFLRTPLALPKGVSTVSLLGLEPGSSYRVTAVPMSSGQRTEFALAPAPALSKGTSSFPFVRESNQAISFAAPKSSVDLQISANSDEQGLEVPLYLSIQRENTAASKEGLKIAQGQADQSLLLTQTGLTPQQLIQDVLVGGGCFQISNVTYSGRPAQIGTFTNGQSNIGFSTGLIMATGDISVASSPNDSDGASGGYGIATPDNDLQALTTGPLYDMANLEFDFVPTQNQVVFEFAFASEEYCEYVNTPFNDVFGFFISGPGINGTKNLAVVPNTNTPVTINTLNHLMNSGLYVHNTPLTGTNCGIFPSFGQAVLELQYDAFTKKMTAIANVIPCQTYHIKLKIADVSDGVWDSAVFLRANSFNAGGLVLASPAYPGSQGSAYESCDSGHVRFQRGNSNTTLPIPVSFTVSGSATPGVDYVPLGNSVVIPAGQMEVLVPVTVLPDLLTEGPEKIVFSIPNSCACSQSSIEFIINDRPTLLAQANDQSLCEGETAVLSAQITGGLPNGALSYQWSTGETTASISPDATGTYSVTVTDGCSIPASSSMDLVFQSCGCSAETFIKNIRENGQNMRGYGVFDSQDGNLYVTGLKQDSALLVKMTPAGTILWMRTFDVQPGMNDNISELITDSEGILVGCGTSGDGQPGTTGFVFRYNPAANTMLWINVFGQATSPYVFGIAELPNGNYLIFDNPNIPESLVGLVEINRPDGTVEAGSALNRNYNLGSLDHFNSGLIHNGKIYGVGRYTNGGADTDMRHSLTRLDLATGNMDWTMLSHVDLSSPARLYGMDMLVEDDHIISVSLGSETDGDLTNSRLFLQKNDLDGNLLWIKRYDLTEAVIDAVDEVISVPDGFVLYGRDGNVPSDLFLLKTDKDGNLQWSKKVDFGFHDFVGLANTFQSQILLKNGHLFFVSSGQNPGEDSQMWVAKTTLDGTVEGNCNFIQPTLVFESDVTNPVNTAVTLTELSINETTETIVTMPQETNPFAENRCKVFINDQQTFTLCFGESVNIGGVNYSQDTTFSVEIQGNGGCDTLRTYTVDLLPLPMRSIDVVLCPGDVVMIGGQPIDHAGTFILSIDGINGACDTIETYHVSEAPYQTRSESISFCSGSSVNIGGQVYTQAGIVTDTLPSANACDTIITYTLSVIDLPTLSRTITFCPGESVLLGGTNYTQPGTVTLTLPSSTGSCDTVATYTLQYSTPAPSNVSITCPSAINIGQPGGSGGAVVNYNQPTASSDCTCPGVALNLTSGLPSGSNFPVGATSVCYTAKDSCGQSKSCCFTVTIGAETPCDVKVNGCIKYELLTITEDAGKNRTYRIRVTNNCSNKLLYTAIQVPDGLVAMEPANASIYTAPSGNTYRVRNSNFSPQYSIRYSSISDSINLGESDIFKYTLPAQASVTYIHVVSRLDPYIYLGAHLNTFYCPIGTTLGPKEGEEREEQPQLDLFAKAEMLLFPNPTSGELYADFSAWQGERLNVLILDSRGQRVQQLELTASEEPQALDLPGDLPNGLYFLEMHGPMGEKQSAKFLIQR